MDVGATSNNSAESLEEVLVEWSLNHRGEPYTDKLKVEEVLQRLQAIQKKLGAATSLTKLFKHYLSWLSRPQEEKNNCILEALRNAYNPTTNRYNIVYQGVSVTLKEYGWLHAVSQPTMSRLSGNAKFGVAKWSVSPNINSLGCTGERGYGEQHQRLA